MEGLRKRPTYNEVVDYIENDQPKIKYPNRTASFLRNSPYLSQLDGDSWIDLEEQESNITKQRLLEEEIKKLAAQTKQTAQVLRTKSKKTQTRIPMHEQSTQTGEDEVPEHVPVFDMAIDDIEMEIEKQKRERELKEHGIQRILRQHLGQIEPSSSSASSKPMELEPEPMDYNENEPEAQPKSKGRPPKPKREDDEHVDVRKRANTLQPKNKEKKEDNSRSRTRSPLKRNKKKEETKEVKIIPLPKAEPKAKSKAKSKPSGSSSDDVQIGEIKPNKSKKMSYWKEQSANELRNQLKLRDPQKFKVEWAFKDREQLLEIIKELIKEKKW